MASSNNFASNAELKLPKINKNASRSFDPKPRTTSPEEGPSVQMSRSVFVYFKQLLYHI